MLLSYRKLFIPYAEVRSLKVRNISLGIVCVSTATVLALSAGQAGAQITPRTPSGPVKGGAQYIKSPDGIGAKIALYDLNARLFPPLAGDKKSRLAYVGGKGEATIISTGGNDLQSASVEVGYVVACGVKDGGFESWIGTNQTIGGHLDTTVGAGAAGGFPFGGIGVGGSVNPGISGQLGATQNQVIKTAPGEITHFPAGTKQIAKPKSGESFGVRFGEKRISVEGCIGSVDAVAYATTTVSTRNFDDAKTVYSEVMRFA